MRYYSDELNKLFDSEKELQDAEQTKKIEAYKAKQEKEKKDAERKAMAKEVEEARKAMVAARTKYAEALEAFCKRFGTYHTSLTGEDAKHAIPTLFNWLDDWFI